MQLKRFAIVSVLALIISIILLIYPSPAGRYLGNMEFTHWPNGSLRFSDLFQEYQEVLWFLFNTGIVWGRNYILVTQVFWISRACSFLWIKIILTRESFFTLKKNKNYSQIVRKYLHTDLLLLWDFQAYIGHTLCAAAVSHSSIALLPDFFKLHLGCKCMLWRHMDLDCWELSWKSEKSKWYRGLLSDQSTHEIFTRTAE